MTAIAIPEGLYVDRAPTGTGSVAIRDAQDVLWVTVHNGGYGDDETGWQAEILRRIAAALEAEEGPSATDDVFLEKVENAWYDLTKGELWLLPGPSGDDDRDELLIAAVLAMRAEARDYADTVAEEQFDASGTEIEEVTDDEIARRIAEAISLITTGRSR